MKELITITLSDLEMNDKPEKGSSLIGKIHKSLILTEVTKEKFFDDVGNKGCTFSPNTFKDDNRKNDNYEYSTCVVFDIDEGMSISEALEICAEYDIIPACIYHSFSSTEHLEKFRIIWVLREPIYGNLHQLYYDVLKKVFKSFDGSCMDTARMFYGGKGVVHMDLEAQLGIGDVFRVLISLAKKNRQYKRDMVSLCDRFGLYWDDTNKKVFFESAPGEMAEGSKVMKVKLKTPNSIKNMIEGNDRVCRKSEHSLYIYSGDVHLTDIIHKLIKSVKKSIPGGMPDEKLLNQVHIVFNSVDNTYLCIPIKKPEYEGKPKPEHKQKRKVQKKKYVRPEKHDKKMIKVDFDQFEKECQLYKEIVHGEKYHDRESRFIILTSLANVNGGKKRVKEAIENNKNKNMGYNWDNMHSLFKSINDLEYRPRRCKNSTSICPYYDTCQNSTPLKLKLRPKRLFEKPYISVEEARHLVKTEYQNALDGNVAVTGIKAGTGSGKSTVAMDLASPAMAFAFPTHELRKEKANELRNKFNKENIKTIIIETCALDLDEIREVDKALEKEIAYRYRNGLYSSVKQHIEDYIETKKIFPDKNPVTMKMIDNELMPYLKGFYELSKLNPDNKDYNPNGKYIIMTTHFQAFMSHRIPSNFTMVIDEDPRDVAFRHNTVTLEDLIKLNRLLDEYPEFRKKIQKVFNMPSLQENSKSGENINMLTGIWGAIQITDPIDYDGFGENFNEIQEKIIRMRINFSGDTINILKATNIIKTTEGKFTYSVKNHLQADKAIILSATLDEEYFKRAFGEEAKFVEIPTIEYSGQLLTCHEEDFSKEKLAKEEYKDLGKKIIDTAENVISYMNIGDLVPSFDFKKLLYWFFNAKGYNGGSGKNIGILGTPRLHPYEYLLYALDMGYSVNELRDYYKIRYQQVKWDNWHFPFYTYNNPILQRIQLYLIWSELSQCVGRPRLVLPENENTVVKYFGKFILDQTKFFTLDEQF